MYSLPLDAYGMKNKTKKLQTYSNHSFPHQLLQPSLQPQRRRPAVALRQPSKRDPQIPGTPACAPGNDCHPVLVGEPAHNLKVVDELVRQSGPEVDRPLSSLDGILPERGQGVEDDLPVLDESLHMLPHPFGPDLERVEGEVLGDDGGTDGYVVLDLEELLSEAFDFGWIRYLPSSTQTIISFLIKMSMTTTQSTKM